MLSPPRDPCSEAWTHTHHVHNANFPLATLAQSHLNQTPSFGASVSLALNCTLILLSS